MAPWWYGTLRRDDGGPARLLASLAEAHVHGVRGGLGGGAAAGRRVDLPTYAFQHQRYWPPGRSAGAGGGVRPGAWGRWPSAAGRGGGAGRRGWRWCCTGRLSLRAQPWLADHAVAGTVLLPGTALVELALRAGRRPGAAGSRS